MPFLNVKLRKCDRNLKIVMISKLPRFFDTDFHEALCGHQIEAMSKSVVPISDSREC